MNVHKAEVEVLAVFSSVPRFIGELEPIGAQNVDGRLEIDNNLVENAIRPTALGKKNWLFVGEAQAGDRGAVLYTIIQSCRRRGIDPYAYLRDVLSRLPNMTNRQVPDVTPAAWAKARTELIPLKAAS